MRQQRLSTAKGIRLPVARPRFKPSFHVEVVDGEGVFLLSEAGHVFLKGATHCLLAPLLDGRRTTDQIVDKLTGTVSAPEAYYALNLLEARGYVVEADSTAATPQAAFWDLLDVEPAAAARRLESARVSVVALGDVEVSPLESALGAMNITTAPDGDFTVVVTDDYLREELRACNADALRSRRPWMLVKPIGVVLWIGPTFYPDDSACWECLAQRVSTNRQVESYLAMKTADGTAPGAARATLPLSVALSLHLAAIETAKAIAGRSASEPAVITLDVRSMEMQRHILTRRPQCKACGFGSSMLGHHPGGVRIRTTELVYAPDGSHRVMTPDQTYAKFQHHVSPVTGLVNNLYRLSGNEHPALHVYGASHNPAARHDELYFVRRGLRTNSSGKGTTDAQAKTSALCEALERYSGVFQGDELRRRNSYLELRDEAIHPNRCMLFSDAQYANRDEWNRGCSAWQRVPARFDEAAEIEWTPVWSLTAQCFKYLPTRYCYYGYGAPFEATDCPADSNGCAAGNSIEEAILQGFCELVERDSVALWWYNRARRPAVDLESFNEPYLGYISRSYRAQHRDLWVLNLTSDLGVPAFAAVSRRTDGDREDILFGFGAHLSAEIAVLRAVTELNQFVVALASLDASEPQPMGRSDEDPHLRRWFDEGTLERQQYLIPNDTTPMTLHDFPVLATGDVGEDVRFCEKIVARNGMEMLVLDQTRPDVGLPVVKTFVPGLRHFWARFAPGRLYHVPVALGWQSAPVPQEHLNPIPMFV